MSDIRGMRPYPKTGDVQYIVSEIIAQRPNDMRVIAQMQKNKRKGRIRTGSRAIPTSHSDVTTDDLEGDFLNDSTYYYLLINHNDTLKWHRDTLQITW